MKVAFDTSVLVAGSIQAHPEFGRSAAWLDAVDRGEVELTWTVHAYAEAWSVLTRLPLVERLDPSAVSSVLESLISLRSPLELTMSDYIDAALRCAEAGVRSGAIFDALHLVAAERAGVECILTLNVKDFDRLSPRIRVLFPPETPVLPPAPPTAPSVPVRRRVIGKRQ